MTKTSGAAGAGTEATPFLLSILAGPMSGPDAPECPFCLQPTGADGGSPAGPLDPELLLLVLANNPWWRPEAGLCGACAASFAAAFAEARAHHPGFARGGVPILPTPVRLGASEAHTGRGVTIAFLDAGFYAHPDLVEPVDRILHYHDVRRPHVTRRALERTDVSSWHGMMTSVVACGNGWLSGGLYRGLASEARLVLVKVGSARRIRHDDIRRGLDWVVRHRRQLGIRVVNVSCGGDYEASYLDDGLSQAAEAATRAGLVVVAAAGNHGAKPGHPVIPPASAPSVLTVGGLDDKNRLLFSGYDMYHSSYGPTVDGLQKPEVIAPGIYVAAPILPRTPTAAQAALYARLASSPDVDLAALVAQARGTDPDLDAAAHLEPPLAAPARRGEGARQQRDLGRVQARRRHELRGADRLVARRADARGEPGAAAAGGEAPHRRHRAAPAPRRDRPAGLGRRRPARGRRGRSGGAPRDPPKELRGAVRRPGARRMIPSLGG